MFQRSLIFLIWFSAMMAFSQTMGLFFHSEARAQGNEVLIGITKTKITTTPKKRGKAEKLQTNYRLAIKRVGKKKYQITECSWDKYDYLCENSKRHVGHFVFEKDLLITEPLRLRNCDSELKLLKGHTDHRSVRKFNDDLSMCIETREIQAEIENLHSELEKLKPRQKTLPLVNRWQFP